MGTPLLHIGLRSAPNRILAGALGALALVGLLFIGFVFIGQSPAGAQSGSGGSPQIASPTPGSTLPGSTATFAANLNGTVLQSSWYFIGSSANGSQYGQHYAGPSGMTTVSGLPTSSSGTPVHVKFLYKTGGTWYSTSTTYAAGSGAAPEIVSPASGSTLAGPTTTFWMNFNGLNVQSSWLFIGSTPGGTQYGQNYVGPANSRTVSGLPTNGSPVYVKYLYKTGGTWYSSSTTYTAASVAVPEIVSPTPGSVLPGANATFSMNFNGVSVQSSWLFIGSTSGGTQHGQTYVGPANSASVTGLPTDGSTVHVRYLYKTGGVWYSESETYTAATVSDRLAPVANLQVTASTPTSITVSWTADNDPRRLTYDFFVNNVWVGYNPDETITSHTFTNLNPSTSYTVGVTAVGDPSGQWVNQHYSPRITIPAATPSASGWTTVARWEYNATSGPILDSAGSSNGSTGINGYPSQIVRQNGAATFNGYPGSIVVAPVSGPNFNPAGSSLRWTTEFSMTQTALTELISQVSATGPSWNLMQRGFYNNSGGQWKTQIIVRSGKGYVQCVARDGDGGFVSKRPANAYPIVAGTNHVVTCEMNDSTNQLTVTFDNQSATATAAAGFGTVDPVGTTSCTSNGGDALGSAITMGNKPACSSIDIDDRFVGTIYRAEIQKK